MAVVLLPGGLRELVGGQARLELEAATLGEAWARLRESQPALAAHILDAGALRPEVRLFLNDEDAAELPPEHPLGAGDELFLLPAIAGGRR